MARFITVKEVAKQLGVAVQTVWKWQREGKIPHSVKLGTLTRWNSDDIDKFVADVTAGLVKV